MRKLAIYGASAPDVLKLVATINSKSPTWRDIVFLDDIKFPENTIFQGHPIVGNRNKIPQLKEENFYFINNVGSSIESMCKINDLLSSHDVKFANLIAPCVNLYRVTVGKGIMIYAGTYIGSNVIIGDFCMIRANCTINHDSIIGNHSFLASGVQMGGRVRIEKKSYIGIGAILRDQISVGEHAVIGMGSIVVADVPSHKTVYGNPAKVYR